MITVAVTLSEQCNLNCTYCGVDKLSKKKIDVDKFLEEFFHKKSLFPNESFRIDLHGGEPLIQWDLIKKIIDVTKNTPNVSYWMPTNGLLLTQEMVDYLNEAKVEVSLSFDGLWQDDHRPQFGNKGSLNKYLEKVPLFKQLHKVKCHTMIYKGHLNLLENHLYIQKTLGLNPELTIVRDVGVWDDESVETFNRSFTEMVDWYIDNVNKVEIPNLMREYLGHIILYSSKKITVNHCGAGETAFNFTDNKMTPCIRFKSEEVIDKIPKFRNMVECETCRVKNYCRKGCLYENIQNDGPIKEICRMYLHIYDELTRTVKILKQNEVFRSYLKEAIYES